MGGMRTERLAERFYSSGQTSSDIIQFWQEAITRKHPHIKINSLEDLQNIPTKIVSKTLRDTLTFQIKKQNTENWEAKIAPEELILKDYTHTKNKNPLMLLSKSTQEAMHKRSVSGHAQGGDSQFYKKIGDKRIPTPYPNTGPEQTLEGIENAKRKSWEEEISLEKRKREALNQKYKGPDLKTRKKLAKIKSSKTKFQSDAQGTIDAIIRIGENYLSKLERELIRNPINPNLPERTITLPKDDSQVGGLSFTRGLKLDVIEFLRGYYMAANMDSFKDTRKPGTEKYGINPGGGSCYLTVTTRLKEAGIDLSELSSIEYRGINSVLNGISHKKRISILEDIGIVETKKIPLEFIVNQETNWFKIKTHPSSTNLTKTEGKWGQYIREERGNGIGDDIVIFLSGFLSSSIYNEEHEETDVAVQSRIIGALLADQIDTLEKDAKYFIPGGQDKTSATYLNGKFARLAKYKSFREKYNIKEREGNNYNLVDKDEVIATTIAGANTEDEHIHCSQRHFYLVKNADKRNTENKKVTTCPIVEYLKHAYFHANSLGKEFYLSDIPSFGPDANENFENIKVSFRNIPLKKIKKTLNNRLHLIYNQTPEQQKHNIRNYFSSTTPN